MVEPILELSTLRQRDLSITIDEKPYPLEDIKSMSITQQAQILSVVTTIQGLSEKGKEVQPAEAETLLELTIKAVSLMLDAPKAVIKKLSLFQLMQVIHVFTEQAGLANPSQEMPEIQDQSTGAKSSPVSKGSMGAAPAAG